MQGVRARYLTLIGLFSVALAVVAVVEPPEASAALRWPTEEPVFQVEGWISVQEREPELTNGSAFLSRDYRQVTGDVAATLSIATSSAAKRIYRAGPEVPFLGNGYSVEPAPASLVPSGSDRGALVARRGDETWLAIHTYGERRGRFGNGLLAWGLNVFDSARGQPNAYYIARVMTRLGSDDVVSAQAAAALADSVFPRIAAWYAHA